MALVIDTGVLYAALDRDDHAHGRCRTLIERADEPLDRRHFTVLRPRHVDALELLPV